MSPSSQDATHGTDASPGSLPAGSVGLASWAQVLGTQGTPEALRSQGQVSEAAPCVSWDSRFQEMHLLDSCRWFGSGVSWHVVALGAGHFSHRAQPFVHGQSWDTSGSLVEVSCLLSNFCHQLILTYCWLCAKDWAFKTL